MEQTYKTRGDLMRQLLELAVSCGRSWQSAQTGYIHYFQTLHDESVHHPIPTHENFLFVLALMRSRITENIGDAKELLVKLLHFQCCDGEMSGNFPVYLHEYPQCKDWFWGVHLLPSLYWIYKQFHHVLGAELKQKVKDALINLQWYSLKIVKAHKITYLAALKTAACAQACSHLLDMPKFYEESRHVLDKLKTHQDKSAWYSPSGLSELIVIYQMSPDILNQERPGESFFDYLKLTWHAPSCSYCGPGWKERQRQFEPQVTLYDYFMGYLSGTLSYRCFNDHPIQLQAALIHPVEHEMAEFSHKGILKGMVHGLPWEMHQNGDFAYCLLGKDESTIAILPNLFSPFRVVWGNAHRSHSLVCQGGNIERIDYQISEGKIDLYMTLFPEVQVEDTEKNQEICFYIDQDEATSFKVDHQTSTTFQLGESVEISDGIMEFDLSFQLHEGYGNFFGHLMKANRPSQLAAVGNQRFKAYDRQIFLRTLQRSEVCTIRATIGIKAT